MSSPTSLVDLPVDIFLLIFPYLDVQSFLHLTSTCKALHHPEIVHENSYWSALVRSTFRYPNQPVFEHDGRRWKKLYQSLLTQSRVYTWGNNAKAGLGHSFGSPSMSEEYPGLPRRLFNARRRYNISWPEKMTKMKGLGVISDLQCGGWSTTLLTTKGALYIVGVLDNEDTRQSSSYNIKTEPVPLQYPRGFPAPYDHFDPSTAVRQFSAGRAHVLALSDSGRIWSWQSIGDAALHVKFIKHDTVENGMRSGPGVVLKVVAGWNKSAALIEGAGIVLWQPLQRTGGESEIEDAALVLESVAVPNTNFHPSSSKALLHSQDYEKLRRLVGEVKNFILLEDFVVFNTKLGKVFAAQIFWSGREPRVGEPVELTLADVDAEDDDDAFAIDVQGSFRLFAVFTRSGAVLTCNQDRLSKFFQNKPSTDPFFTRIPALQHNDVIQMAFGDWHFHALHSSGRITSYGKELHGCGALGLGGHGDGEGRLRGIRYQDFESNGELVPHAYTSGRTIWFEREKRAWLKFLTSGGVDPEEAMVRERMALGTPDIQCQGEVSEWIEQEARDWESKFGVADENEDELGAYFVLGISAGGWHSGAIVMVNEDLVQKLKRACEVPDPNAVSPPVPPGEASHGPLTVNEGTTADEGSSEQSMVGRAVNAGLDYGRKALGMAPNNATSPSHTRTDITGVTPQMIRFQRGTHPITFGASPRVGWNYVWSNDHFPRLQLSDGTEMPGTTPFDEWRYGRPDWDLDFSLW